LTIRRTIQIAPKEGKRVESPYSLGELCKARGCGRCPSCELNNSSTTTSRKVCALRVCEKIDPCKKAQPSPPFRPSEPASPFSIYFTSKKPKVKCSYDVCFRNRQRELGGVSACIITSASKHSCNRLLELSTVDALIDPFAAFRSSRFNLLWGIPSF